MQTGGANDTRVYRPETKLLDSHEVSRRCKGIVATAWDKTCNLMVVSSSVLGPSFSCLRTGQSMSSGANSNNGCRGAMAS
jgi:hypothetical protein